MSDADACQAMGTALRYIARIGEHFLKYDSPSTLKYDEAVWTALSDMDPCTTMIERWSKGPWNRHHT